MDSLRRELLLRVTLQNTLLMVSVALFTAFAVAIAALPRAAWLLASAQNAAILGAALQWCHHGVRTAQIKQYLTRLHPSQSSWEVWLPAHRPPTLLGSRWMISTKGVFLGLGLASISLAALTALDVQLTLAVLAMALWAATAGFLLTNPKE
jgi:hypothetical protein